MKQEIAAAVRKLGLISLSDQIRYRYARWKMSSKNKSFLKAHTHEVFPEHYMIYETFKMDYERWYISGKETAAWIGQHTKTLIPKNAHILDWGCGPGRVIRHLPNIFPHAQIQGCDYNKDYTDWCRQNLKNITFTKNELHPPLPYEQETFDLVYALSILTHLSAQSHYDWIKEMHRVLIKGGLFLFTTHGLITRKNLIAAEQTTFDKGELVIRDQVKEGHRMYVSYHPPTFIYKLIEGLFEIHQHIPGAEQDWGLQQDTWILKKL